MTGLPVPEVVSLAASALIVPSPRSVASVAEWAPSVVMVKFLPFTVPL